MAIGNSKEVAQYSLEGELIKIFNSQSEAYRETGVKQTGISACVRGRYKQSGGFIWKEVENRG